MVGRENPVEGWGFCESCGQYSSNISYTGRKWIHLFFIPVFTAKKEVRVVKECRKCKYGLHVHQNKLEHLIQNFRTGIASAKSAIRNGDDVFIYQDEQIDCNSYISNAVTELHSLGDVRYANHIVTSLKTNSFEYSYQITDGTRNEFKGNLTKAKSSYTKAAELKPQSPLPLSRLSSIYLIQKDYKNAQSTLEKMQELQPDNLKIKSTLIDIFRITKNYEKLSETYENSFKADPKLMKSKKIYKAYLQACKQCGKVPTQ